MRGVQFKGLGFLYIMAGSMLRFMDAISVALINEANSKPKPKPKPGKHKDPWASKYFVYNEMYAVQCVIYAPVLASIVLGNCICLKRDGQTDLECTSGITSIENQHSQDPTLICLIVIFIAHISHINHVNSQLAQEEVKAAAVRSLIGSRPPRCDQVAMRCKNCGGGGGGGHCEAVQVPVDDTTADQKKHRRPFNHYLLHSQAMAASAYSAKGSGNSNAGNYKPMCWKCKCGNFIFNP
ncbi:hypothetical protein DM860_006667 [Cuscuta australis]|uniref:Epidermal patterning factor-like protein n=1 Tax=Cuscuta australis TaxID=267555 RepID=A0A328D473_9ASTE|nr:hypothetical protein DM860_006667 [Cuscuta australis]